MTCVKGNRTLVTTLVVLFAWRLTPEHVACHAEHVACHAEHWRASKCVARLNHNYISTKPKSGYTRSGRRHSRRAVTLLRRSLSWCGANDSVSRAARHPSAPGRAATTIRHRINALTFKRRPKPSSSSALGPRCLYTALFRGCDAAAVQ